MQGKIAATPPPKPAVLKKLLEQETQLTAAIKTEGEKDAAFGKLWAAAGTAMSSVVKPSDGFETQAKSDVEAVVKAKKELEDLEAWDSLSLEGDVKKAKVEFSSDTHLIPFESRKII